MIQLEEERRRITDKNRSKRHKKISDTKTIERIS